MYLGSRQIIGADLLVPLFTMMLINAQLPNVHMILNVLQQFGDYNEQGDISYTIANLEGSIMFIMGLEGDNYVDDDEVMQQYAYDEVDCSISRRSVVRYSGGSDISSSYKSSSNNSIVCPVQTAIKQKNTTDLNGNISCNDNCAPSPVTASNRKLRNINSNNANARIVPSDNTFEEEEDARAMKQLGIQLLVSCLLFLLTIIFRRVAERPKYNGGYHHNSTEGRMDGIRKLFHNFVNNKRFTIGN